MLMGILSDSHGKFRRVRNALRIFERERVQLIVHCGDVGGVEVFDEVVGLPFRFVWGNTDYYDQRLLSYLATVGITAPESIPMVLSAEDKRIAVFHGHEDSFERTLQSPLYDYVFHGHTHVARDERVGDCRVINPGALTRTNRRTVAVLDTQSDRLTFHEVFREE